MLLDNLNIQRMETSTTTISSEGTKTLATPIDLIDTTETITPAPVDIIHRQIESALALDLNCISRFNRITSLVKFQSTGQNQQQ